MTIGLGVLAKTTIMGADAIGGKGKAIVHQTATDANAMEGTMAALVAAYQAATQASITSTSTTFDGPVATPQAAVAVSEYYQAVNRMETVCETVIPGAFVRFGIFSPVVGLLDLTTENTTLASGGSTWSTLYNALVTANVCTNQGTLLVSGGSELAHGSIKKEKRKLGGH
jgi:hypothetical protein